MMPHYVEQRGRICDIELDLQWRVRLMSSENQSVGFHTGLSMDDLPLTHSYKPAHDYGGATSLYKMLPVPLTASWPKFMRQVAINLHQ